MILYCTIEKNFNVAFTNAYRAITILFCQCFLYTRGLSLQWPSHPMMTTFLPLLGKTWSSIWSLSCLRTVRLSHINWTHLLLLSLGLQQGEFSWIVLELALFLKLPENDWSCSCRNLTLVKLYISWLFRPCLLAASTNRCVLLFDTVQLKTGPILRIRHTERRVNLPLTGCTFPPSDGARLVSADKYGRISFWRMPQHLNTATIQEKNIFQNIPYIAE